MSVSSAPSQPEGSGTFSVATWNIRSGRGAGLAAAAKGLRQMGVGCAVLTETKLTDDRYPKFVQGYHVIASRATSPQQGGIALLWRESVALGFLVEAVNVVSPNVLTFQLVTGEVRFFVMGAYIPPGSTTGVDDLRSAWDKCPANCHPLLLGDLNINFGSPRSEREEIIVDLLDEIGLADMSRKFQQRWRNGRQGGGRWTWRQRRGGQWHQSQPDYCMARERDGKLFRNVAVRRPRIHDSDHRAVVASIRRGRPGQLKAYRRGRMRFPLQLPPVEEQDEQTRRFGELREACRTDTPTRQKRNDWISDETWRLIAHRAMLRRTGRLCCTGGRRLRRQIGVSLCKDRTDRTASVGAAIESELGMGNVHEAFRHLKGWYRAATDTQAKPCRQTLDRQTTDRVDLYARRNSPGEPLPINIAPVAINDDVPTDGELRGVVGELTNGRAAGASGMRAEHVKKWLRDVRREEDPEGPVAVGAGDNWRLFVQLVQAAWTHGAIPRQLLWSIVVLIPKGGGDYRGIGLLEPIWKCIERVIEHRLNAIELHDSLHGCRDARGTGTAIIEAKLAQQLSYLELKPFYGVFLDLRKAFDAMDRERCILLLEGYGAGPLLVRLVRTYWRDAIMVCRASGYYGQPFKAGRGVTQGGPLSAKLFNIVVDAVVREWMVQLRQDGEYDGEMVTEFMATFFAIFYVDDAYLASRDAGFLQHALDLLVDLFERVGLQTNTAKTQTMICTPGRIRTQLPSESYRRMMTGRVTAGEWNSRDVECRTCGKEMKASSLSRHLADVHDIYQQTVVAEELLELRPPVTYTVSAGLHVRGLPCPFPRCLGRLKDGWMMRRHFRDVHPLDLVRIPSEGCYSRCERCAMQVNPFYPRHVQTKECQVGTERRKQREAAISSALALRQQFTVRGDVLERVEVFKYLGRMLAQDDDDVQAVRAQLRKARAVWARVGQVLRSQNVAPFVAARFYQAIVQAVLLYGSETWVISRTALARLEGFHIRAAYRMAKDHKPKRGPGNVWEYPRSEDVLRECGMKTMEEYIAIRRQTVATYVATRPILAECQRGERKRGAVPHQWWWELPMDLDGSAA